MEIRHFMTFKKVVELGSFTLAAEHLRYTQSSVTSHIQTLEKDLGVVLFDRIGRKVILTSAGEKLLEYTEELLRVYSKIESLSFEEVKGELRIGAPESLTLYRLEPILNEFSKCFPKVNISLISLTCNDIKSRLLKGDLDIALLLVQEFNDSDLILEKLINEPLVLVSGIETSENILCINEKNSFLNTSVISNEKECDFSMIFETYLKNNKLSPNNKLEFGSIESIKRCVINGLGISLLPLITVQNELEENKLKIINLNEQIKDMYTYLAYHKDKWKSPAMESFIKIILSYASKWN